MKCPECNKEMIKHEATENSSLIYHCKTCELWLYPDFKCSFCGCLIHSKNCYAGSRILNKEPRHCCTKEECKKKWKKGDQDERKERKETQANR